MSDQRLAQDQRLQERSGKEKRTIRIKWTNDSSVKRINLSPSASRFSPRVENDLSLNQREEKERESGMWNGSHPPGRIIAGHYTYVHTYSRTHVTRVQGRHKWVGALTLARSRARACGRYCRPRRAYPLRVQRPRRRSATYTYTRLSDSRLDSARTWHAQDRTWQR
jgi:hypothetical protein